MSGVNKYYIELETNVRQTLADVKSLQDRMDKLEGKEHKLDIGIDTEKLEKVISNLDKMLNSLGKGTGDFKQFEKLSDELKNIKKSLGSIDDKGISNLYNSINSIDKAMNSFVDKLQIVKKDANGNIVNTSQIGELANLFVKIEDHLNSIHKAFGEAGKDKGLSPLIDQVNELKEAMSGLKLNLNLDLGDIGSKSVEQVSKAQRRQLEAYRSLFDKMKGTGKYTKEMMKFIEPEGLSDAELSGIYKQMIENAKKHYSSQRKSSGKTIKSNVYKDILGNDYEKELKLSRDAIRRAEKSADKSNVLSEIFGGTGTDLTGVISQLETIANKLDTIASSAKTMGDAFSSGLNVSASLEEITKLTERVKELEVELQKVKSVGGAGIETDLSSGTILPSDSDFNNILKNLNRTKSELKEIVEITKQVNYDKDGHRRESYTLKDKYGSTEIYGKSSKTDDGNIIKKNIKDSSLKEAQAAQKSAEAQAKAEAKRQEQLAKAKAAALSKSRQNAKNETQTSVNNAVKKQLESWREIQKIRLQMSKTTDTGELSRLEAMKKVEQERYLDSTKILNVNRDLYDYEAQSYKLQKASKDTTNAIATKRNKEISSQIEAAQKFQSTLKTSSNGGYFPSESYNKVVTITNQKLTEMAALQQKINSEQNGVATAEQAKKMSDLYEDILKQQKTLQSLTSSQKGSTSLKNEKAIDRINKALDQNTRMSAEAKAQLRAYIAELQSNPAANVEEITAAWMGVVRAEKEAGRGGKSIFSAIGEKAFYGLAGQIAGMVSLWDVINGLKQAAAEVVNINSAFTDLSKVSDISLDNLESQLSDFSDIAKDVGATITDTIDATSNWSRNGYNLADSKELAKVSLIYKNVGDGIDIDEADSSLVSTLQGFNLQASDAMSVIDRFNEVSNNFAIDSGGIGEALQRSAASFNAANTDLSKSIALITGTNVTLQDPERVGNMWKTVSARLRGAESELTDMGEDTDGMVESTSKLREIIKGMTGFDIMADKAGTQFKDIYDIVVGIGEKWQDLNDIDRASLLEKLAGKNQSNALAAALNNVQTIKDAYQTAENSTGSAMQEQSRYEQSIQYSIDRIKASAQQLAATSFKSSFLKGLVDTGNAGVEVITKLIDKVGILGTALGGVGIFSFIKNLDLFITKLVTSYIRIQRKWFCKQMCVVTF